MEMVENEYFVIVNFFNKIKYILLKNYLMC